MSFLKLKLFKNTVFDVKPADDKNDTNYLEWLKRNNEWLRMPGYNAMLCSFKCKPWPANGHIGHDSTDWIGKEEKV